jgi:hypothetical protein
MVFLIRELIRDYQIGVVSMVTEYVLKDVKLQLATGASAAANVYMAGRQVAINEWSKSEFPLSYGGGLENLSAALAHSMIEASKGLQFTDPRHISIEEFGHLLYNMG